MNLSQKDIYMLQTFFADKPVKRAYLFGSYSRNEASEGSDIDLLVEMDYSIPMGLGFVQMVIDLEKLLNKKVDLVTTDGLSKHVKPLVDKDKQLIYQRSLSN